MSNRFPAVRGGWGSKRNSVFILAACVLLAGFYRFSFDYLLTLSCFLFFVLMPGIGISVWMFGKDVDLLERIATAFGCGMALNIAFFFIRGLLRFPSEFASCAQILGGIIGVLALITVCLGITRGRIRSWFQIGDVPFGPLWCMVLLCVVLLFNDNSLLLTSDSIVYLPQMIEWEHQGAFGIDLTNNLVTLLGKTRLYRMVIQPFFLYITGVSPVVQYQIFVSVIGVCFASSFYMFSMRIFKSKTFLTISMVLFIFHFGGFWFNGPHSNYSWFVAWGLYFISCAFLLDFIDNGNKRKLIISIILACCTLAIHSAIFLMALLSILSLLICIIIADKSLIKWLRYSVIVLVCSVILGTFLLYAIDVLLLRLPFLDYWGAYRVSEHFPGHISAFGSGYIVNPAAGPALFMGLWGLLSIACLPVIVRNRHRLKRSATLFLVSNTVFPLVVLFNPLLVSVMLPLFTYVGVERLTFSLPYISVITLSVVLFIQDWRENPGNMKMRLKTLGILSLVFVTGLPVFLYRTLLLMPHDWGYRAQPFLERMTGLPTGPLRYNHSALLRAMEFIKNRVPPEALFVTDPITSELFPVLVKNPVLERWRPVFLNKQIAFSTSMKALGPDLHVLETSALLKRKRVDFILINDSWNSYTKGQYFRSSSDRVSKVFDIRKFAEDTQRFEMLFEDHGVFVFRFLGEGADADFKTHAVFQIIPLLLPLSK